MASETERLLRETDRRLSLVGGIANGWGATEVLLFLLFLAPNTLTHGQLSDLAWRSIPVFVAYMALTLPLGRYIVQRRPFRRITPWLKSDRAATEEERALVLRYPVNYALLSFIPWCGAAIVFSLLNLSAGGGAAGGIAATILLGGMTSCSLQYLSVERIMRPITARALMGGDLQRSTAPGVGLRFAVAWTLATGVPVLGIVAFATLYLAGIHYSATRIVGAVLFLALLAISAGLGATLLAARAVADPLRSMRRALAEVETGDLSARVDVDDGSEVGLLEAGFNRMVAGLAERQRLRDAFGAFVDPSITERVLREGIDLEGEEVDVSLMFVDVRGFTSIAERLGPREVVAKLNELFARVVPLVLEQGGHANKFVGDGLLAIFGAPDRLSNHAERAVAAGKAIVDAVGRVYGDELSVGVGINSGGVVVGTIGGGGRVEFTVIGDAVNTAARVQEATRDTGDDLLITEETRRRLSAADGSWVERPSIQLRGKAQAVGLYAPAEKMARA